MVAGMNATMQERIDALCRRQCAFALYCLPGEASPFFCMAGDGRTEELPPPGRAFVVAGFDGRRLFIPAELEAPPLPDAWAPFHPLPTEAATTREQYASLFRRYTGYIHEGLVRKIVLARTADIAVGESFSASRAFLCACRNQPAAFKALVHTPQYGTWLFCTPEQLLTGCGSQWHTMALAGTRIPCTLPWDTKNKREQALVTEFIRETLMPLAEDIAEAPLENLRAGSIEHLCTRFSVTMPQERVLTLLEQLPPTPAVCGSPVAAARKILQDSPDIDRSCYAGYLGPWHNEGAQLYVSLRCMQLFPSFCRLYAGGGLMPDSDEQQEWQETENKMACMQQAIQGAH